MSSEQPADAPEHRSQALSPVSPKPLHFPSPQNIPVLENQMDPVFNDTSNHPATPPETTSSSHTAPNDTRSAGETHSESSASQPTNSPKKQPKTLPDVLDGTDHLSKSQDEQGLEATEMIAPKSDDPSAATHDATSDINDQAESPASSHLAVTDSVIHTEDSTTEPTDLLNSQHPQNPNVESSTVDIQAILDNLISPSPVARSAIAETLPTAPGHPVQDISASKLAGVNGGAGLPPRPLLQQRDEQPMSAASGASVNDSPNTSGPGQPSVNVSQLPSTTSAMPPPPNPTAGAPGTASSPIDTRNLDEDVPWGPDVQKAYDAFLAEERKYVADGQWEKFPAGSRLFIGNLSSERVTKRDLFHVFHKHGRLAQISIKQAYGFAQFLNAEDCHQALQAEEGVSIRGRKIHLEVSKPQKSTTRNRRRSRSPESRQVNKAERYRSDPQSRRETRGRDDYRPGNHDIYRTRSPDRYHGRRRSRSPSDRGHRNDFEDGLPLPPRAPHEVPDIQILAKDDPDGAILRYIEQRFSARNIRANTLILNLRLNESAVIRRQIMEGVLGVLKIDRIALATQKFSLSLFNRQDGSDKIKFEEYDNLDIQICIELVARAQSTHRPPSQIPQSFAQYGIPAAAPSSIPQSHAYSGMTGTNVNYQSGASGQSPDAAMLASLLTTLHGTPQTQMSTPTATDLARIFGTVQGTSYSDNGHVRVQHPPQQGPDGMQGSNPDVQNIMAQLARYGRS